MNSQLIRFIRGYVIIGVNGPSFEQLINRLVHANITVWNIRRKGNAGGECHISLADFFRLKRYLRETGCRIRIKGRFGLPFMLDKLGRRKSFAIGAAAFVLGMYMLSSLVWSVEVTGNEKLPEEQIIQAAKQQGVFPLQWKFRLQDQGTIADQLARTLPNVSWVGVELQGTKLTIRVVEATVPDQRIPQSPRHLVSAADGVITRIIADRGVPQVGVNSRVKEGDILISGILGNEENREAVVAEGEVRGLVWYEYKVQVPIVRQHETLTGNERKEFHLILGNRSLQLTGYWEEPFANERTAAERKQLQIGKWSLPIGWMVENHQETVVQEEKLTPGEAAQIGVANARADLMAKLHGDAVIEQEKILQASSDNGKVILQILFEAEIDLAVERPILAEELAPKKDEPPR